MNKVVLIGRLTKDVEFKNTPSGTPVANFSMAVDRRVKNDDQPSADFLPIVVWGKTAEFCNNYFGKGLRVTVSGRIQTRSWENAEGVKCYATEIVAEEVGFADGKKSGEGSESDMPY